jgi:hypothetical protein
VTNLNTYFVNRYCLWIQVSQITPAAKQAVSDTDNIVAQDGQSFESAMTALHLGSSQDNDDGSDVSLKLG